MCPTGIASNFGILSFLSVYSNCGICKRCGYTKGEKKKTNSNCSWIVHFKLSTRRRFKCRIRTFSTSFQSRAALSFNMRDRYQYANHLIGNSSSSSFFFLNYFQSIDGSKSWPFIRFTNLCSFAVCVCVCENWTWSTWLCRFDALRRPLGHSLRENKNKRKIAL